MVSELPYREPPHSTLTLILLRCTHSDLSMLASRGHRSEGQSSIQRGLGWEEAQGSSPNWPPDFQCDLGLGFPVCHKRLRLLR